MRKQKRVNDNKQFIILHPDDEFTGLQVIVPEGEDHILIEVVSTIGERSFTLNSKAMDFINSLVTISKRH